jgi:hypothetical protein
MPCAILPADLMIEAGISHSQNEIDNLLGKVETGDRPTPCGDDDLLRLLHDFADRIESWFEARYPEFYGEDSPDDAESIKVFVSLVWENSIHTLAREIMDEIHTSVPVPMPDPVDATDGDRPNSDGVT